MDSSDRDSVDFTDEIIERIGHFAVGFVRARDPRDGPGSEVLGSGTLVEIDGRRGILTCGHVVVKYDKLTEVGLARFVSGPSQRRKLRVDQLRSLVVQSSEEWSATDFDLGFSLLLPDVASSIGAQGVFLNLAKNRTKIDAETKPAGKCIDAVVGLVSKLSGEQFVEGREVVSPMRAVLYRGRVVEQVNEILTFEFAETDPKQLPTTFGGMSGGGLWRIYFTEDETGFTITEMILLGVASWEHGDGCRLACQGWGRIDQGLISEIVKRPEFAGG